MDVTPHQLRTIELREAWRGYRQDDVDELLDQVAGTIERLQAQVKRLTERLAKVEDEAGLGREADEMLRRTLLLAQRTADAAVSEAQERARRVLSESEVQAHSIVSGAEEEARRVAIAERRRLEGEVRDLGRRRDALLADVESLETAAGDHRRRLREFLEAEISRIDSRPMPTAPAHPDLHGEPADASPTAEGGDEASEDSQAEVPAEPVEARHDPVEDADHAVEEPAGADERIDDPDDEDTDFDAFADLDAGMADLLPRRRRRRRREVDDEVDDEFFSELRAAVTDETPLGPTDDSGEVEAIHDADFAESTEIVGDPEATDADSPVERTGVEPGRAGDSIDHEIVLDDMADRPRRDASVEEAEFFDQDAADADVGSYDETPDWDRLDDGIPDGGRLRSAFRRRG